MFNTKIDIKAYKAEIKAAIAQGARPDYPALKIAHQWADTILKTFQRKNYDKMFQKKHGIRYYLASNYLDFFIVRSDKQADSHEFEGLGWMLGVQDTKGKWHPVRTIIEFKYEIDAINLLLQIRNHLEQ